MDCKLYRAEISFTDTRVIGSQTIARDYLYHSGLDLMVDITEFETNSGQKHSLPQIVSREGVQSFRTYVENKGSKFPYEVKIIPQEGYLPNEINISEIPRGTFPSLEKALAAAASSQRSHEEDLRNLAHNLKQLLTHNPS